MADILVVDDTPTNIRLLSKMLGEKGYQVRKATSGQMAITAVNSLLPDLILLDISMPKMDGYEVCMQLKQNPTTTKVPIIFLSALDATEDKVKAFRVGGSDYITKPFQLEEVIARIQHQLTIQDLQKKLQSRNDSLQQTLNKLTQTQTQLIQQAKMSSLGQLVAGIAHEINNPVSFIAGNLKPARNYIQDLLKLVNLYQQEYPDNPDSIQELVEEIDLDFIYDDLHNLMESMQTGANRIKSIVSSLRTFSRLDEAELKYIDLKESINSTLMLLQHRLQPETGGKKITVIQDHGNLPLINCYASQMNQVLFNLLSNAIDALKAKDIEKKTEPPTIWISTDIDESETVTMKIKDNGRGISEKNIPHVFEPFFTTQPIGEATGLGLAISYQIVVEKHKGQLTVNSLVGQETEFTLTIPRLIG